MLRQEINLYQSFKSPTPVTDFLTWKKLQLSNIFFIFLLFLVYLSSLWNVHSLKTKKVDMQIQLDTLQKKFTQIKSTYPPLFFSQDINQSLNQLQQELVTKEKTLDSITNQIPFSNKLIALSETIIPNVWLTNITILKSGQEIILKGKSTRMENLHSFLGNVSNEKIFSGFGLHINDIENASKDTVSKNINFEISIEKK